MSAENNGGRTGYYDLPLPSKEQIVSILNSARHLNLPNEATMSNLADQIIAICPQTLNDLIEYKGMEPWRHEVFKATYALKERAKKSEVYSIVREINKIIYYAGRGLAIALKEQK